jgi:hypothetical protein
MNQATTVLTAPAGRDPHRDSEATIMGGGSSCAPCLPDHIARLMKTIKRKKNVLAVMLELQLPFVDFACKHGRITIGIAIKLTRASSNKH